MDGIKEYLEKGEKITSMGEVELRFRFDWVRKMFCVGEVNKKGYEIELPKA